METHKKDIVIYFVIFFGTLAVLWLFLVASAQIPNSLIKENMEKSAFSFAKKDAFAYCDGGKFNGIADNYADTIWLNVAWHMGKDNPFVSTIDTKYYDGEEYGENVGFYLAVTDEETEPNVDYTRYWHGTAGVIRILHLFTDVNGIKNLGFAVAVILAAIIMLLLVKNGNTGLAVCFFISLCMIKVWNIRLSMEYQPAFIICFFMCILYLLFEKKGDRYLVMLSVAGGVLIAFFDFLTTETIVIVLPLIFVITVRSKEQRVSGFKENIKSFLLQCIAWIAAYGGSFIVKWSLASLLTGQNKFILAMSSAGERVNGSMLEGETMAFIPQIFAAPASNVSVLFGAEQRLDIPLLVMGLLLVLFIEISVLYLFSKKEKERNQDAARSLLLLGSVVLIRYMVLSNHSFLHSFFTYRGLISMIMALFSILVINCEIPRKWRRRR